MNSWIAEEQISEFGRQRFLHVKNVFTPYQVEEINKKFIEIWIGLLNNKKIVQDSARPIESLFPRLHDYHLSSPQVMDFALSPDVIDILEKLTGEEMLLISCNFIPKAPGTGESPPHQDNYSIGVFPDTTYAALICLDAHTKENGCLKFLKSLQNPELITISHSKDNIIEHFSDKGQAANYEDEEQWIYVEAQAGDIIIFDGNVIHGSSANESNSVFRRSLLSFFSRKSVEKVTLNFNKMYDRNGKRVRKRLNTTPRITENQSVFLYKDGDYYKNNNWK